MNWNKVAKVWGVITLILIALVIWAISTRTVVVAPGTVVPSVTPPEVVKKIDSLKVEVIKREQEIKTLVKKYEDLKTEDNALRKKLENAKVKLDSITDFSGDAASLLRELTNIAETPRE